MSEKYIGPASSPDEQSNEPPPPVQQIGASPELPNPVEALEVKGSSYGAVLRLRNFRRLWIGMAVSSLGDWVALFALLSVTNRLSPGNTLAVAGLMISRVLPAFLVGPLAGVLLDRIDRRKAMVVSDVVRACLIATVPFAQNIPTLYAITFMLEVATLVWLPAKDALVPNLVPKRLLVATNSLALFTTYGVFPLGAIAFTALAGVGEFVGNHIFGLRSLGENPENLAFWIDTASFIASAIIVSRVRVPLVPRDPRPLRLGLLWEELVEGLRYLRERGEVARVMRSIAIALAGGAVIFSLGSPYTSQVLQAGPKGFGLIVAALGTGMGVGVLVLGFVGDRFPKGWVAALAVTFGGVMLLGVAATTNLPLAVMWTGLFGAFAGVAYANLFALLQALVEDEVRGRTFASVQVVIRISLFTSLVLFPALSELFSTAFLGGDIRQGIRLAIASGGLLACGAGLHAAWDVYRGRIDPGST
ncbi:MAG: MFS transporter [Actinomycetota bacterium]